MRIGLHGPKREARFGGAATFEGEFFEGLLTGARKHGHTLVVFSKHPRPDGLPNSDCIEWVRVRRVAGRNLAASARRIVNGAFTNLLRLPCPFRNEHWIDAYLHQYEVEFFLNLIPETIPTEVPYMTFIWDLMHRVHPYFPECSHQGTWSRREALFAQMIRRAAILGVGTEIGKREVMDFFHVPEHRLHVMPYPTPRFALEGGVCQDSAQPSLASKFGGEYVFYPASFYPHKDHVTLLHALAILRDRHGAKLHLALSGSDGGNLAHVKEMVRQLGLERQVHFEGFVSRQELVRLYQGAVALVFPSVAGPDNIPPLEAFGLGCPAIVAEILGAREQTQGAALLFPPGDEQALAEAILKVRNDGEFRKNLIAQGKIRARKFTTQDLGLRTLEILREFQKIRRCWAPKGRYSRGFNVARLFGG